MLRTCLHLDRATQTQPTRLFCSLQPGTEGDSKVTLDCDLVGVREKSPDTRMDLRDQSQVRWESKSNLDKRMFSILTDGNKSWRAGPPCQDESGGVAVKSGIVQEMAERRASTSQLVYTKSSEQVDVIGKETGSPTTVKPIVFSSSAIPRWLWMIVFVCAVVLFLAGLICVIVAFTVNFSDSCSKNQGKCDYSAEAQQTELPSFLKRAQQMFYDSNPNSVGWQPDIDEEHMKSNYKPYNPDPDYMKKKTDTALGLLREINAVQIDTDKLKPREHKALVQVKHYLQHIFGTPYADNYYAGDWMMGPDLFCWQPICGMSYELNAYAFHVKPKTYNDVTDVIAMIKKHKVAIDRYRKNVEMGVHAGMVRTKIDCRAGVDALKVKYKELSLAKDPSGVLKDWYTKIFQKDTYLKDLENGADEKWTKEHGGKNVNESIKAALKEGFGRPMLDLINYLEGDHMRHCVPNDVASGLANLPLDYVYTDGLANVSHKTTKKLPTGEVLNGIHSYSLILSYFTTTSISADKIYEEGRKQLDAFYKEVKKIAQAYMGISDEAKAVNAFREKLNSSDMWHNNGSFPANESDENAHKTCVSPETAEKFCPVRWAAITRWANYCRYVMGMLAPKFSHVFYYTGLKSTTPNCPVEMLPHYNPSNGAQFYMRSDAECSRPSYFGLPFFLKNYGPIFQEWSVTGHEARPGHHTQVQGLVEHFRDTCGGVPGWLDSNTYYTAFTEGWGLYSENPIISNDTDTYKENLLQKFGMLKWQVWRAVRLIVDTGLHTRGMTRTEALKMFEDYAWDTSDFAVKEVTRYQSDPGQATAYMLGRLELISLRKKAEKALGKKFSLQEFHYQVLSQGSAPLSYLRSHVNKYITCATRDSIDEKCKYILKARQADPKSGAQKKYRPMPPRPPKFHYI